MHVLKRLRARLIALHYKNEDNLIQKNKEDLTPKNKDNPTKKLKMTSNNSKDALIQKMK